MNRLLADRPRGRFGRGDRSGGGRSPRPASAPGGDLWYRGDSSVEPPSVRDAAGATILELTADHPPPGTRSRWLTWSNPSGDQITGFLTTPPGSGPFPTIASIHGGPEWHHTDLWDPGLQAFVDEGFAVLQVNYRGSTGRGKAFREELKGQHRVPGDRGHRGGRRSRRRAAASADPDALFLEGWSWGGYLTTLIAGLHPDRWRAACAGIPVGDYVAAHYESAPTLRAWDIATMGGSPMDLPELYRERNPMTYVDRVQAPMLLIAGEHDSRCPLGQVMVTRTPPARPGARGRRAPVRRRAPRAAGRREDRPRASARSTSSGATSTE